MAAMPSLESLPLFEGGFFVWLHAMTPAGRLKLTEKLNLAEDQPAKLKPILEVFAHRAG
jgi:hypothetical protein